MHRSLSRLALATAALAALALVAAGGAIAHAHMRTRSRKAASHGLLVPTNPGEVLPLHGGTVDSLNWSGYAVTTKKHDITSVTGSFKVPSAGMVPPGFAATWAGIGGYNTQDLIQAGTAEQSLPSNSLVGDQYYAWYELLPNSETQLQHCKGQASCAVKPGQQIKVTIRQTSTNVWKISMRDAGHWSWSKTVKYQSSHSSAEWILEAPTLGTQTLLAPVGTVHFGPNSTYRISGDSKTIAQGKPTKIVLSPAGVANEATPSALAAGGQKFNDCAYAQSCPAP